MNFAFSPLPSLRFITPIPELVPGLGPPFLPMWTGTVFFFLTRLAEVGPPLGLSFFQVLNQRFCSSLAVPKTSGSVFFPPVTVPVFTSQDYRKNHSLFWCFSVFFFFFFCCDFDIGSAVAMIPPLFADSPPKVAELFFLDVLSARPNPPQTLMDPPIPFFFFFLFSFAFRRGPPHLSFRVRFTGTRGFGLW